MCVTRLCLGRTKQAEILTSLQSVRDLDHANYCLLFYYAILVVSVEISLRKI